MKPVWEIYKGNTSDCGGALSLTETDTIWILHGSLVKTPMVFEELEGLFNYVQSFHEKTPKERTPTRVRSGDSSTPKHPYDRDETYWEKLEGWNNDGK